MSTERRSTAKPTRRPAPGGSSRPATGAARPRPSGPRSNAPPSAGSRKGYAPRGRATSAPREGYKPREGYAPRGRATSAPREGYKPREGYAPRGRATGAPREGYKPREGFKPREGYAPRGRATSAPREGYKPREGYAPRGRATSAPREGYKPREGDAPRVRPAGAPREGFRPREGYAPRGRATSAPREGYKPREGFAPRPASKRPFVRREQGGAPSREGFRPRPEGARPSFNRPRPAARSDRQGFDQRPRFERPRDERPRTDRPHTERPEFHDDGGDQTGAVNRSRPVYPQGPAVRWRRDGKPSQRPAAWGAPHTDERPSVRNGGPGLRPGRPGTPPRGDAREERRSPAPFGADGPSLPADPREAALRILHAVDTRSAFSDRLLDGAHARAGADPRDRALLHELVKGSLRWRGRLDAALDARVHVGLANTQPWIRNILRLGAYQILFLDRVPMHAAVDESVKLAHKYAHPGAAGLVNSVLRRLAEERGTLVWPEGDDAVSLAAWGSHPLWIVERWLERFGPADTRALLSADNRTVPTGLRTNTLKNTREQLMEMLAREGVESRVAELSPDLVWVEGHHSPGALHCFREGLCTAQDESESLVGRVVAPRPHERILDLCAAPGGKSTHLAELMGDEGEVWAMERDVHRVETLKATLERLGTHSVHVVHGDGRTYVFPMPFDHVLVDAPCSGMGVLARRADARWRKGPEVLAEMPPVQLELLRSAARHLSPGGSLVYSVCSFEPEETEHVVARFLAEHPGWVIESVAGSVPAAVVTPEGTMLVLPHRHGCDGAFAVRLRKP